MRSARERAQQPPPGRGQTELNRAVAVGMAVGPQAALEIADRLSEEPALDSYRLLPSVRGELLLSAA